MRKRKLYFGTVIHGTTHPNDLIPAFIDCLREMRGAVPQEIRAELRRLNGNYVTDEATEFLDYLFDVLNAYAPRHGYFGATEGDGADFGFWLGEELDYDIRKVSDLSEIPGDYVGEVAVINDHGNITLYDAYCGKFKEVWSIV